MEIFLFFLASFYLAIFRKNGFVIWYILSFTDFLGFYHTENSFILGGYSVGFIILNACASIAATIHLLGTEKPPRHFSLLFGGLFIFAIYAILRALYIDKNLGLSVIIEGKHFLSIAFLAYLMISYGSFNQKYIRQFISFSGVYLSVVLVVQNIAGIGPPAYLTDEISGTFKVAHPTLICLSFFTLLADDDKFNFQKYFIIPILIAGLYISGHFALFASAIIFGLIFYPLFVILSQSFIMKYAPSFFFLVAGSSLGISTIFEKLVIDKYYVDLFGLEGSISGRLVQNEYRWLQVDNHPWIGSGFLRGSSSQLFGDFGYSENRFMSSFLVIDAGYLNLILIAGYVGVIFYILLIGLVIRYLADYSDSRIMRGMICFILAMAVVNITWSVFSFAHGLIPIFLAIWLAGSPSPRESIAGRKSGNILKKGVSF